MKKPQPKPGEKVIPDSERRQVTMEQLPAECKIVLNGPGTQPDTGDEVASTPAPAAACPQPQTIGRALRSRAFKPP